MATKKSSSNALSFVAIFIGIFLISTGVLTVDIDSIIRSLIMAVGFFGLVYGVIAHRG